jgi:hypothetical protein
MGNGEQVVNLHNLSVSLSKPGIFEQEANELRKVMDRLTNALDSTYDEGSIDVELKSALDDVRSKCENVLRILFQYQHIESNQVRAILKETTQSIQKSIALANEFGTILN